MKYNNIHSSKGLKKKIFHKIFYKKYQRHKEDLERHKNFSINEAKNNDTLSLITKDEKYINDAASIVNTFNNVFISVAEIVHSKIKFSNKSFIQNKLTSTNKEEIYKIISSFNTNKPDGPNSIPTKVFHLLPNQISNHLATICNLSFSTGVFPTILKTAKLQTVWI